MNNTLLEMLLGTSAFIKKKTVNIISNFVIFLNDFQNTEILYQFNRAKQLQFSCELNQPFHNAGCKVLRNSDQMIFT